MGTVPFRARVCESITATRSAGGLVTQIVSPSGEAWTLCGALIPRTIVTTACVLASIAVMLSLPSFATQIVPVTTPLPPAFGTSVAESTNGRAVAAITATVSHDDEPTRHEGAPLPPATTARGESRGRAAPA